MKEKAHPLKLTCLQLNGASLHRPVWLLAPSLCRYEILRTCIAELQQAGIVTDSCPLAPYTEALQLEEAGGAACGSSEGGATIAGAGAGAGSPLAASSGPSSSSCSMEEEGAGPQHGGYLR